LRMIVKLWMLIFCSRMDSNPSASQAESKPCY
jgi:hypothetical protein